MLRDLNRIGIREELPKAGLKLTPEAVPKLQGVEFYLTSFLDTQRAADATNRPVTFIAADQPTITGDKATLRLGLDVSFPTNPEVVKLCCCSALGEFRRDQGRWVFVKWGEMICG